MQPRKHAAVIKAWADGAEIQVAFNTLGPWQNFKGTEYPLFYDEYYYRVKPKEPIVSRKSVVYIGGATYWTVNSPLNVQFTFDPDSGELLSVEKI